MSTKPDAVGKSIATFLADALKVREKSFGWEAAALRMRKESLTLEKLLKEFRKASLQEAKGQGAANGQKEKKTPPQPELEKMDVETFTDPDGNTMDVYSDDVEEACSTAAHKLCTRLGRDVVPY